MSIVLIMRLNGSSASAATLCVLAAACVGLASCGDEQDTAQAGVDRVPVVASFYPLEEAAKEIGGERVSVVGATPVGGGPHDADPSPKVAQAIEQSKVVFYIGGGFQPAIEKAVGSLPPSATSVDLLDGMQLRAAQAGIPGVRGDVDGEVLEGGSDPHVWVDPARFVKMATRIRDELIVADPAGREVYEENGRRYLGELAELDRRFEGALEQCRSKVVVTSHAAFGYLTDRYGLRQAAIAGISPEAEPDPSSLAATAKYAKANGVKTVFFETLVPRKLSETVAQEIGATTDALNPVEGLTKEEVAAGRTYTSIMDDNLQRLQKGLGCTAE